GGYTVNIQIYSPVIENTTVTSMTPSTTWPWPIISQETLRNIIIIISVTVVVIAIIVLFIRRRRRVIRVEEEEWGTGGSWGEEWEETF
ncbi:MAG: hypothetical protein QXK19_06775, partial [Nitrososphaerota archaeon]